MQRLLAQNPADIIGKVTPTLNIGTNDPQVGLVKLLNVGLNLVLVAAGIFMLFNLILAGYKYIFSSGDAKQVSEANLRITYTVIGLGIIALAPLIAAVVGLVLFGRWDAVLNPDIIKVSP